MRARRGEWVNSHSFILIGRLRLKTTELVEGLTAETIRSLGFSLEDVEFQKEYGDWVLTLFIDKEGGVTIDECELVNNAVEPILDREDPIEQPYYLSISSLGLDRPLKKDRDFQRNLGKELEIKLYAPQDGKKEFTGILKAFDAESFTVETEKAGQRAFSRKDAALVRPLIKF